MVLEWFVDDYFGTTFSSFWVSFPSTTNAFFLFPFSKIVSSIYLVYVPQRFFTIFDFHQQSAKKSVLGGEKFGLFWTFRAQILEHHRTTGKVIIVSRNVLLWRLHRVLCERNHFPRHGCFTGFQPKSSHFSPTPKSDFFDLCPRQTKLERNPWGT